MLSRNNFNDSLYSQRIAAETKLEAIKRFIQSHYSNVERDWGYVGNLEYANARLTDLMNTLGMDTTDSERSAT